MSKEDLNDLDNSESLEKDTLDVDNSSQDEPLDVDDTPLQDDSLDVDDTPLQDEPLDVDDTPLQDEPLDVDDTPLQDDSLDVDDTPLQDDSLDVDDTSLQDEPLDVEPNPLQDEPLDIDANPLQDEPLDIDAIPLQDEPLDVDDTSLQDDFLDVDDTPLQDEPLDVDDTPLQDEPLDIDAISLQDDSLDVDDTSLQDDFLDVDATSLQDEPTSQDISEQMKTLENVSQNVQSELEVDKENSEATENNTSDETKEETSDKVKDKKKKFKLNFSKSNIKPKNKSNIIIYIAISTLLLLIITLILVFTVVIGNIKKQNLEKEQTEIEIDFDELDYSTSSSSQDVITLNKQQTLDGQTVVLSKVVLGSKYTYAYFKDFVDTLKFDIYIVDENNNLYSRDLTFNTSIDNYENVLRFEKIDESSKILKLYFVNNVTGEKTFYSIIITDGIKVSSARYLNNPIKTNFEDFNIIITNAIFSYTALQIDYLIENTNSSSYTIQSGLDNENTSIYLLENGLKLINLRKTPLAYSFTEDNLQFNRMDFTGLSSLKSKVTFCLSDLYKRYNLNTNISYSEISGDKEKVIPFDKYNLVVEGLAKFNDTIVLVLHGEDTEIDNSKNETDNRIETIVDAEATIKTSFGMEITVKGNVKSSTMGTDVTFNIDPEYSAFLANITESDITINLKAVLLKIDDAYVNIDIEQAMTREVVYDVNLETQILNSFKTRLAYKSGKIDLNSITGFDSSILSDTDLMQDYTPESYPNAIYSAQIMLKGVYENTLYFVVQENWKSEVEATSSFYRTHLIKLQKNTNNNWVIISDKIIK